MQITKEESQVLKAISIIAIILCHFGGWIYEPPMIVARISGSFCQAGVFMFLFLSGYGIMSSYKTNGIDRYWAKRLNKIYIPFLMVSIPQLLMEIWKYKDNIGDMFIRSTFLSAVGLYPNNLLDGTLWFIPFILLQYFIFWISFKFSYKKLLIIGTIIGYVIFKRNFTWVSDNDIYAFAFLMGCLYADRMDLEHTADKKYYIFVFGVCLICWIGTMWWYEIAFTRMLNCIFLAVSEIILVNIIMSYSFFRLPVLSKIGNISYELYLTEGIFFWNKILYDLVGYNYIGLLLHMLVIWILAVVLQNAADKVNNRLNNSGAAACIKKKLV